MNKKLLFISYLGLMLVFPAGCSEEDSEWETDVEFEVLDRSQAVAGEGFQNGAELIHDEDMLKTSAEASGVDIDAEDIDFDEELLFEVSITENGCGFSLVSIEDDDGLLKFMFELTPVATGEADPGDIVCSEVANPAVFYVKTDQVDFHNLDVYGSEMNYE